MSKKRKINRLVRIYAERELSKQIKLENLHATLNSKRELHQKVLEYKAANTTC